MLLVAASPAKLPKTTPPAWVTDWLEKRIARSEVGAKRADPKTSKESRQRETARRIAKREKLIEAGIEALEQWLRDFARLGLATAQTAPASFWEEQAARMVDCQLPGAARMIREMSTLPGGQPDWAQALLLRLGRLYLLTQAYRKRADLPETTQQDVQILLGWNVNQDELVAAAPGIVDYWLVLDSRTEEDEKTGLRTQVNWLWGKKTRRPAQILNYAFHGQPFDTSLVPGLVMSGELVYFPGAYPIRAIIKDKRVSSQYFTPSGFPSLAAFLDEFASALGKNPWLEKFPAVLENVVPLHIENEWLLRDGHNMALPLASQLASRWEFLALSGGHPLTVFCLWDGFWLTPLAAWEGERFASL